MLGLCYVGSQRKYSASIIFRVLSCTIYILFVGLRSPLVGVDSHTYYEHFYTFGEFGCNFVEVGFDYLNRLLYHAGFDYTSMFLACIALASIPMFFALERCDNYFVSASMLYILSFVTVVNGMRQVIVCGLFLFAYRFIEERRLIPYLAIIGFGLFFHTSAFILFPLYFIVNLCLNNRTYLLVFLASLAFIFIPASSLMSALLKYFDFGVRNYSELYSEIKVVGASSFGFIYSLTLRSIILFMMLQSGYFKKNTVLANLMFLALISPNIGYSVPLISRITMYFTWFIFLGLPQLVQQFCNGMKNKLQYAVIVLVFLYGAGYVNGIISAQNMVMPYTFCFEYKDSYR